MVTTRTCFLTFMTSTAGFTQTAANTPATPLGVLF
jgi:hypothetical protein